MCRGMGFKPGEGLGKRPASAVEDEPELGRSAGGGLGSKRRAASPAATTTEPAPELPKPLTEPLLFQMREGTPPRLPSFLLLAHPFSQDEPVSESPPPRNEPAPSLPPSLPPPLPPTRPPPSPLSPSTLTATRDSSTSDARTGSFALYDGRARSWIGGVGSRIPFCGRRRRMRRGSRE